MAKATHYTVRESFITRIGDDEVEYHKGEVVDADDPGIKRAPDHFEPLVIRKRSVEQATAAPGEKRG
jgi:hypothetical protein